MDQPAVFSASYSDWRIVKTRGVVIVSFEIPLNAADLAYNVLGGMPTYETERRFAIARLKDAS